MTDAGQLMYEMIYRMSTPRWDDGEIPPQVAQLACQPGKTRRAIDLGCGTGTQSIYLAQRGFTVTGVDSSPTALQKARQKAAAAGVDAEFVLRDITRLDGLAGPFDIALDIGCLHGLNPSSRQRCAEELSRLMPPGGTLLIWGGERSFGFGWRPGEVEKTFAEGFRLLRSEASNLHGRQARWYWLKHW